jgi:hypothetical protein
MKGGFVVTLVVSPMGYTAVIDEALRAREVPPVAIKADELDRQPIRPFHNARQ